MSKIVWHYTIGDRALDILEGGVIKRATAGVPEGEKPIVWFSTNQVWEQTACKFTHTPTGPVRLNKEQTAELGNGLYRFGVLDKTAPYKWRELRQKAGMTSATVKHLESWGKAQGANIGQWRGTFEDVPIEKCVAIEVLKDGRWLDALDPANQ